MAPKKGQKMSLNEFLGDSALGSWADEMDSLPTAPSSKPDDGLSRGGDRRRDDFGLVRSERSFGPPREDLPLPTQPPFTAFIGNLSFDIVESELEDFFGPSKVKTVKIIKDREDKPKGFGYVEFAELEGLKEALAKSGSSLAGRVVRVSVAEPPKERGFGAGTEDDAKFASNWRREGPLPDLSDSRDSSRRREGGPERAPSGVAEGISDWRSSQRARPEAEAPPARQRGPGFFAGDGHGPSADAQDTWVRGAKFKPSTEEATDSKFGGPRARAGPDLTRDSSTGEESDWRSAAKPKPTRGTNSPNDSTPPTPQMGRRKLELLPRSSSASTSSSPLASPKIGASAPAPSSARSNPFGAAKPVDVSARENEVAERLEKEREVTKERAPHPMSRTSSRSATERSVGPARSPTSNPSNPPSPRPPVSAANATIRPAISFAHAASGKKETDAEEKVSEDAPTGTSNGTGEATREAET